MRKRYLNHWPFLLTGPLLAVLLIVFWYLNQGYLALGNGPVVALFESPMLTFGLIIFGSFISSFVSGEYSIKTPVTYEPLVYAFAGGIIMGAGAVVAAMSAHSVVLFNLTGIFNLTAFMITKGWVYAVFMILGGFVGSKLFSFLILKTSRFKKEFYIPRAVTAKKSQRIIFFMLLGLFTLFIIAVGLFSVLTLQQKIGFGLAVILLVLFGVIAERGIICMSSMLKEWFIAKNAYVWRSVLFTIMCLALLYQLGLKLSLYSPVQLESHIRNISFLIGGSFLMGFGFIFADGCFIGSLWKAGQGNIVNISGIFGMLLGIGATQFGIGSSKLMDKAGVTGAQISNYLSDIMSPVIFLVILWVAGAMLFLIFKQKHYRY